MLKNLIYTTFAFSIFCLGCHQNSASDSITVTAKVDAPPWTGTTQTLEMRLSNLGLDSQSIASAMSIGKEEVFRFGRVGEAGQISPAQRLVSEISQGTQDDALAVFETVYLASDTTPEGRLYSLFGIAEVSPATFETFKPKLLHVQTPVTVQQGCLILKVPFSEAAKIIVGHIENRPYYARTSLNQ